MYWRIIRINEDGSIRLIYNGYSPDANRDGLVIGHSAFNTNYDDNAYVGYMYGETNSSSYLRTHTNTNESAMKIYLDNWYEENLLPYSSNFADAGFCNDRSIASSAGTWASYDMAKGYQDYMTLYGAFYRNSRTSQPQFKCPKPSNDLFTLKNSTKGNGVLDYPIGLLTADEYAYAGGDNSYLNRGSYFTMSPTWFEDTYGYAGMYVVYNGDGNNGYEETFDEWHGEEYRGLEISYTVLGGEINEDYDASGVRPVINLRSDILITGGNGTATNPYVIKTN